MKRFERGAGGTAKKAKFESKNTAYIKERVQMAKAEALAEIRAEQAAAWKQDLEEENAPINLLQGRTDVGRHHCRAGGPKKQVAALTRQNQALISVAKSINNTSATRVSAPEKDAAAIPNTAASTGLAVNSAGQAMPTKTNRFGEHFFVEEQLCANCNKK